MSHKLNLLAAASLVTLTGCMNMAPEYERVDMPVPAEFDSATVDQGYEAPLYWEGVITSPALSNLVKQALENNRDLQAAAANVRAAQANLVTSRSQLWPYISASATSQVGDTFDNGSGPNTRFVDSNYAQAGVSAWELDFFGRISNLNAAALQTYLATAEGERATKIALVATVAETWLQLASDQELLRLANQTVKSQSESLSLTDELFEAGTASELDVRRASASVSQAQAQAAQYEAAVRRDLNALRYLTGTDLPANLASQASLFPAPVRVDIPVGQSSAALLMRPDVISAERQLLAANANIGAARAAFFPSISLTGNVGVASSDLDDLFSGDATSGWTFAPSISVPIFDFGSRKGRLDAARATADAALANYESTIQQAFRDVSDTLAVSETIDKRLDALEQLADDTTVTLSLSSERFKSGLDGYLTVLDAQREDYSAKQQLIIANLDRSLNALALYRALGTWEQEAPDASETN